MEQGGTVIIFQPRAEWHTLKAKFGDVQIIGGAYLSDMPFAASHPKLYAEAVVEQGVSMVFYTPDVEDEDKLINFVDRFLDHLMKAEETKHRPIMVVLEEAHEYAPMSPKGHVAAPWVFNRMVKRLADLWTSGRKLNIVPVAITQRPQQLNYSVRQLCNVSFYGQFAPQDIKYIDKECLAPFKRQGVEVDANALVSLKAGQFLIIEHGSAYIDERTVQRITPHGADTPSLALTIQPSEAVKATVTDLGEKLRALLEAEQAKESETEALKRKAKAQEEKIADLEAKVKLGLDLKALLQGNGGEDSGKVAKLAEELETERRVNTTRENLQAEKLKELSAEVESAREDAAMSKERMENLSDQLSKYNGLALSLRAIVGLDVEALKADIKKLVSEATANLPNTAGGLVVEKSEADLEVLIHREKVTAEESTLRGQVAMLIVDGELDDWITTRTVTNKLRQSGWPAPEKSLMDELLWYTKQHILDHELRSDGSHRWKLREKERVRVREA